MHFTAETPVPKKSIDNLHLVLIIWLSVCFACPNGCPNYCRQFIKNRPGLTAIWTTFNGKSQILLGNVNWAYS